MNYFKISISHIEHLIDKAGYIIQQYDKHTSICTVPSGTTILTVSHDKIEEYLTDTTKYKSYNLFLRKYKKNMHKDTDIARAITEYSQLMLNKMIYIYSVKYLYAELQKNSLLIIKPVVDK